MPSMQLDPPDACTADCSWCGNDPRPTAFCSKACEDASHEANAEPAHTVEAMQARDYDRELAYLARVAARCGQ